MDYRLINNIFCFPIINQTGGSLSGAIKLLLTNVNFLNKYNIKSLRAYDSAQISPFANINFQGTRFTMLDVSKFSLYINLVNKNDEIIVQNFPLKTLTGTAEADLKKMYQFNLDNIDWEKCFISGTPQSPAWSNNNGFILQVSF